MGFLYDYYLKKENSGFSIEIENISNSDHEIKLSSPVSSIDPENYRYMEFNLENNGIINSDSLFTNNGIINSDSLFTLELGTSASIYGTVKVPGNLLISGKNKIKVDFIDKIVWVNNVVNPDSSWNIGNGKKTDLITININNIGKGTLFISDIVLTDPNLEGDFFMDDYSIAYGKSSISMTLLGTSFQGNSIYKMDKGISAIGYKIVMPSISSPIVIKELFNYGESLTREDELILSTKYIVGNLSLKLDKNNDTSLRTTTTSIEITPVKPISLHSSATLTQSSGDELENMNKEFVNSYSELIPTDNLDIKNSFVAKSRLNINSSLFNILTTGSVAFDQSKAIINSENNKYTGNITINVPLSTLSITTLLESSYFTSINNNTQLLSNGFESIINNFGNTNPYKNIDLETLFFLGDSDQFYNSYAFIKERTLDSSISLKVAYNSEINSFLNFLIPNSIEGSFTKKLSRIESSQTSLLGYKIDGKFNLNSFVKNKIEYVNIFNIEKNSNDSSIKWDMRLLIDLPRNNSLELSNNLMYDTEETSNILKGNYTWDGKDGPVYIVPLLNYAIEKPYQYTNKEILYLNSKNLESWTMGLRHETELNISDVNKTLIFLDATYDSQSKTPLILGFGITLTLIF
ncbi:MAG: hypothetical protein B6229_01280 [Spirochaetaceae bacterium 4572_7]|nr:MAG: hypothetical protein B6229_01280 [Spirochaetaceae bacterium 4572_7]